MPGQARTKIDITMLCFSYQLCQPGWPGRSQDPVERAVVMAGRVQALAAGQAPGAAYRLVAVAADPEPGRVVPAVDAQLDGVRQQTGHRASPGVRGRGGGPGLAGRVGPAPSTRSLNWADIACRTTAELSASVTRRPSGPRLHPAALRQTSSATSQSDQRHHARLRLVTLFLPLGPGRIGTGMSRLVRCFPWCLARRPGSPDV
jgi:hypothetical protein